MDGFNEQTRVRAWNIMSFNLNEFRSKIDEVDLLRNNRFKCEIFMPRGMINTENFQYNMESVRRMEFMCEVGMIPSLTMLTHEGRKYSYGPLEKRPVATLFSDVTLTFFSDGFGDTWRFFNQWMRLVNNSDMNKTSMGGDGNWHVATDTAGGGIETIDPYEVSYRDEYTADLKIKVFDTQGYVVKNINLRESYPISMNESQLNWSDNDSLMRLPITFTFLDWYVDDPNEESY